MNSEVRRSAQRVGGDRVARIVMQLKCDVMNSHFRVH
jgi:hypothetical protein